MSENEIQRILEKIDELRADLNKQNLEWHNELHTINLRCTERAAFVARAEQHLDLPHQSQDEWLQNTVGKTVLMLLSGVMGAFLYIVVQRMAGGLIK